MTTARSGGREPLEACSSSCPTRREWLVLVGASVTGARQAAAGSAFGRQASDQLVVCGWDEVFILALDTGTPPSARKVWSWRATETADIPAELHPAFRTTDDCKPVDDGRRILISSSGGAIALVDRETGRTSFHARVTNAHSIEMLPGGRIAAAASVSNTPTGNRIVIFDTASGRELAVDGLRSGHGVVWDEGRGVLWALGGDVLRRYIVGDSASTTRLERTLEIALPDAGGHDLVAIPDSPLLFVSTLRHAWYFDRERLRFSTHESLADAANVKSYSVHPRTGRVVYVQAEGKDWWAEHLHFRRPDATLRLAGERLYKARWL